MDHVFTHFSRLLVKLKRSRGDIVSSSWHQPLHLAVYVASSHLGLETRGLVKLVRLDGIFDVVGLSNLLILSFVGFTDMHRVLVLSVLGFFIDLRQVGRIVFDEVARPGSLPDSCLALGLLLFFDSVQKLIYVVLVLERVTQHVEVG